MKKYEYKRAVVSLNPQNPRHRCVLDELMNANEKGIKTTDYFVNVVLELKTIKEEMRSQAETAHFDWLMANREYIKALLLGEDASPTTKPQAPAESIEKVSEMKLTRVKTGVEHTEEDDSWKQKINYIPEPEEEAEDQEQEPSIGSKLQELLI